MDPSLRFLLLLSFFASLCLASSYESSHNSSHASSYSSSPKTRWKRGDVVYTSVADAATAAPVYLPAVNETETQPSARQEEFNEAGIIDERTEFDNTTTTITFWRPYVTYVRQIPSALWTTLVQGQSIQSLIRLNLISIGLLSALAFVSFLTSPESEYLFERMAQVNLGTRVEEMARTVELAIDSYGKVDPEVCLRMAACTLGKQNRRPGNTSATASDGKNSLDLQPDSSSGAASKEIPRDNLLFVTIQLLDKLVRSVRREDT